MVRLQRLIVWLYKACKVNFVKVRKMTGKTPKNNDFFGFRGMQHFKRIHAGCYVYPDLSNAKP